VSLSVLIWGVGAIAFERIQPATLEGRRSFGTDSRAGSRGAGDSLLTLLVTPKNTGYPDLYMRFLGLFAVCLWVSSLGANQARAEEPAAALIELSFVPTDRAQIAVWVETADGKFMRTLALTYATASAGIGNRPGALQMNSGYRWPYGRREGVLPVWAHRRAAAPGAKQFKRVIFQDRTSEGLASRTSNDNTTDDYYCLAFDRAGAGRDALDAVTCASANTFSSDKGRFISENDVKQGYAEPFETEPQEGVMRPLSLDSLYPPRRNIQRCSGAGCLDHPDLASFRKHASEVMPEIDAVSRATPAGHQNTRWLSSVPASWDPDEKYVLFIEVNVEGDYNDEFNAETLPTPTKPAGRWDSWAQTYGYAYRGQPSVVYQIPFRIRGVSTADADEPVGYGALHGEDGDLRPMASMITDDPKSAPGSGADRLLRTAGKRVSLRVTEGDPCKLDEPPPECGLRCDDDDVCGKKLVCGKDGTCQSECMATDPPGRVVNLNVSEHPERQFAHMWARLSFEVPESDRPVSAYDVLVRPKGGMWDEAYTRDATQPLLPVALDVCVDPEDPMGSNVCLGFEPGDEISADLTNLNSQTEYEVSVVARDGTCNMAGPAAIATFTTPEREFATVSPCFVATAAYGSPLASEIGVLRAVRDRYLASHGVGRALIDLYYRVGPDLADTIRAHPWLRSGTRFILSPIIAAARWWLS